MSTSNARRLLAAADREAGRLRRHLMVAAALRELIADDPIVVGGTAEEYWTADRYHQTDLDVVAVVRAEDRARLEAAGFKREGRHWVRGRRHPVAVEIPKARLDGDPLRTMDVAVPGGTARVIGPEDLYLDRVRQATVGDRTEGIEFHGALAIALALLEELDWDYLRQRIEATREADPTLGGAMSRIDARVRRRARRARSPGPRA